MGPRLATVPITCSTTQALGEAERLGAHEEASGGRAGSTRPSRKVCGMATARGIRELSMELSLPRRGQAARSAVTRSSGFRGRDDHQPAAGLQIDEVRGIGDGEVVEPDPGIPAQASASRRAR